MYNLMIIEKNTYKLEHLLNYICENFPNIRVCYISYDDKKILEKLKKDTIDFILLDCNLNELENIKLIDYIIKNNLCKYKKSIIIKLDRVKKLDEYKENDYIFSYTDEINMKKEIKNLIDNKNNLSCLNNIKNNIKQQLVNLNYNYSYDGTKYLEEVILEIYKIKYEFDGNLSKNIYPIIAKRYNKKIDTIYGNIKQATNLMINECDTKKLMNYFGYYNYVKPKVQEIIFTVLNKIE